MLIGTNVQAHTYLRPQTRPDTAIPQPPLTCQRQKNPPDKTEPAALELILNARSFLD